MLPETTLIGKYRDSDIRCCDAQYTILVDIAISSFSSIGLVDREKGDLGPVHGF